MRSLFSCQASIIHFLQIVVLLVILASFSMLIHPIVIRTTCYSHFIIFINIHFWLLLPQLILIVASQSFPRTDSLSLISSLSMPHRHAISSRHIHTVYPTFVLHSNNTSPRLPQSQIYSHWPSSRTFGSTRAYWLIIKWVECLILFPPLPHYSTHLHT